MERNIRNNIIEISDITYLSELTLDILKRLLNRNKNVKGQIRTFKEEVQGRLVYAGQSPA